MKKLYSLLLLATALTANAQQLPNIGFDEWKTCNAYCGSGQYQEVGEDPKGWNGANVYQAGLSFPDLVKKGTDNTNKYVQLTNTHCGLGRIGAVAPAYVTLGTPWSYAKTRIVSIQEADGGSFGGIDFKYRPDAITFKYKSARNNTDEPISVVAYTWKGSFSGTQNVGYNPKQSETMVDRDSYVLGLNTNCTKSKDAKLLASINTTISGEASEWTPKTIEFKYDDESTAPQKLNVIFCAGNYFGERSDLKENNTLSLDDVSLVYYHALKDLKYNGVTLSNFTESTLHYDLSNEAYDESKLSFVKKGVGASVLLNYDENTAIATITVKGEDYDSNNESISTYTIQFAKEETTSYANDLSVSIDGSTTAPEKTNINLIKFGNAYSLELKNFMLEGEPIGNVKVTNLDVNGNTFSASQTINITAGNDPSFSESDWAGPYLGEVPVNVVATVNGDQMVAQITIKNFPGVGDINVIFAPTVMIGANASVSTEAGVNNVIVNRTFAKGWNTVCLPFNVAVTSLQAAKAQEFVSSNGSSLTFNEVADGVLKANVPYLVFFNNEVSDPFYYGGKVEATNPTPIEHSGFTFVGNYEASKSMNGLYGVASEGDVQKIMLGTAGSTLPATCAYFATKNLNANGLRICFDGGEVTGINQVNGAQAQSAGAVYNLQGIKVSNHGTNNLPAGLYIMQGKKVIVK